MDEDAIIEREAGLHKALTRGQITMMGLGGAIGTGLFMGSGIAIGYAGPAVMISYAIAACIAVVMVLVCIGAGLRFEYRFDRIELRAEAAQHLFQHVVAPDAQPIADHLNIGVAISDLPGEPGELLRAIRRDLNKRLALSGDAHD